MDANSNIPVSVRTFSPSDETACKALYRSGDKVPENDTGADIDDIASAYLKPPGGHFWVAHTPEGEIVGMIGGSRKRASGKSADRAAELAAGRGIGSLLMEAVLQFCQERQYLKVKLDTFMDQHAAMRLFEKFRFVHDRTKTLGEKQLMYFYLDLYSTGRS